MSLLLPLHIYLHLCKATNLYRLFTIIFYWSKATFMVYIYIYIYIYTGAQQGGGRGEASLALFSKSGKSAHLWVNFSSKNVVLRVSRRKNFPVFCCGDLFPGVFHEMFIKVPYSHETFPVLKNFWSPACYIYIYIYIYI